MNVKKLLKYTVILSAIAVILSVTSLIFSLRKKENFNVKANNPAVIKEIATQYCKSEDIPKAMANFNVVMQGENRCQQQLWDKNDDDIVMMALCQPENIPVAPNDHISQEEADENKARLNAISCMVSNPLSPEVCCGMLP